MITHIRMKNFKSWKDSGEVKLAPLTGFFGTNSSGKSSLLQMLLLLKQTAERKDVEEVIFFGDESSYVNLGDFREVVHGHKLVVPLVFEFQCQLTHLRSLIKIPEDGSPWEQLMDQFAYESIIRVENGKSIMERLSYGHSLRGGAKIVWSEGRASFPSSTLSNNGEINIQLENCYGRAASGTTESVKVLQKYVSAFEELFSHVFYLGPTRAHPQRYYHWEGAHPKMIDQWGSGAIDSILSAGVRKLKSSNKEDAILIEDRISEWLQRMELAYTFRVIPTVFLDDRNYEVRIQKSPNSAEVTLADMGYGLADVLPMLIYFYYVDEGSTFILEQPGIHLHPMVQAQLADLLIEVVNERNLQILLESHSEHLLNRLQRRIAEENIDVDKTALYFCRNDEGVSNIEHLKMDELGNILNWPEKFFGDEMGDLFAMTKAQSERRKIAEG